MPDIVSSIHPFTGRIVRVRVDEVRLDDGRVVRQEVVEHAQSITVATAACYEDPTEGANALGPIFRYVFWFSVLGAAFVGLIGFLEAYVFPGVIPTVPQ